MAIPPIEIKITADTSQGEVSLKRLAKATEAAEQATNQYRLDLEKVDSAIKKGIITQGQAAKAIKQAETAYERATIDAAKYANATARVTKASGGAAGAFGKLGNVSNRTRSQIQNTSFQLQDIVVQLQGGTSATTALAQQLPQLAGAFGAVGAVIGVGFALGIPAVSMAMKAMGGEAESLEKQLESLADISDSLSGTMDILKMDAIELQQEFGAAALRVREFAVIQAELLAQNATDALNEYAGALDRVGAAYVAATAGGHSARNAINDMSKELKLSRDQAVTLGSAFKELQQAQGIDAQRKALQNVLATMNSMGISVQDLNEETRGVISEFVDLSKEVDRTSARVSDLTTELWAAAKAAAAVAFSGGRGGDPRQFGGSFEDIIRNVPAAQLAYQPGGTAGVPFPKRRKTRKSGAADKIIAQLEGVKEALRTEGETLLSGYEEQQLILQEAFDKKRLSQEEFQEWSKRSSEEYNDALAKIERDKKNAMLSDISGAFGDLSALMSSENKKLFNVGKAAAIAEASISGYKSAVSAWEKGMDIGGPPVAAAFTAASLVKTGALISSIASQQIGSSSSGGGGGGGAASTASTGTVSTLNANVRFTGDPSFASQPGAIGGLADALMTEFSDRGITVVTAQ